MWWACPWCHAHLTRRPRPQRCTIAHTCARTLLREARVVEQETVRCAPSPLSHGLPTSHPAACRDAAGTIDASWTMGARLISRRSVPPTPDDMGLLASVA